MVVWRREGGNWWRFEAHGRIGDANIDGRVTWRKKALRVPRLGGCSGEMKGTGRRMAVCVGRKGRWFERKDWDEDGVNVKEGKRGGIGKETKGGREEGWMGSAMEGNDGNREAR